MTDASLWVGYFLAEDRWHQAALEWVDRQLRDGGHLVAPLLLLAEVGGAISRRTGDSELGKAAVQMLLGWPHLELVPEEELGLQVYQVACAVKVPGADALYITAALRRSLPLITCDNHQIELGGALVPVGRPGEPLRWPRVDRWEGIP